MSQNDHDLKMSATEDMQEQQDSRLVPAAESIRYRRRAEGADKKNEKLAEELEQARTELKEKQQQLETIKTSQNLFRSLASAGTKDLEAAALLAEAALKENKDGDIDAVVEKLKKEKGYLFANDMQATPIPKKTSPAKERLSTGQAVLQKAASKAAATNKRADLQEYLRIRRNYI